ncbi:hypothetical protein TNCV_2107841 [Trichonephila clavipes]|nr:hypothetical protein TNCV_2107841 [Trichonephila clavipes]
MLYKDQTIEVTAFCDVWMRIKSVVSVAAIIRYNRCHAHQQGIKEALGVSLRYSSPCGQIERTSSQRKQFNLMSKEEHLNIAYLVWSRIILLEYG